MACENTPAQGSWGTGSRSDPDVSKIAILGWIAFVVLAFVAGGKVGTQTLTHQQSGVGDSGRAAALVDEAFPKSVHESVMVASPSLTSGDPRFRAAVGDVVGRLERTTGITEVVGPYAFVVLFGLSMDDHVFILSRVREAFDRGMSTEDAVKQPKSLGWLPAVAPEREPAPVPA